MPGRAVVAVGMEGPLASQEVGRVLRRHGATFLTVKDLEAGLPLTDLSRVEGGVLVLGDPALGALDPAGVLARAPPQRWEIVACPERSPPGVLRRWRAFPEVRLVAAASLEKELIQARQARVRVVPPLEEWAGDWIRACACGRCPSHLRHLGVLRKLSLTSWAKRIGITGRALWDSLRQCLGIGPREILRRFKESALGLAKRAGWKMARIALSLGYANASNLRRAIRGALWARFPRIVENPQKLTPYGGLTPVTPGSPIHQAGRRRLAPEEDAAESREFPSWGRQETRKTKGTTGRSP